MALAIRLCPEPYYQDHFNIQYLISGYKMCSACVQSSANGMVASRDLDSSFVFLPFFNLHIAHSFGVKSGQISKLSMFI